MSFFFHKFKHSALIVFFFRWRWCNKERNILCQSENRHLKPMFFQKCTFLRLFFIKIQTNPFFFCFLMTMVSKIKQNGVALFWNTQLVMKAFQNYSFFFCEIRMNARTVLKTLCFPQTHKMKLEFQNSLWLIFFFSFLQFAWNLRSQKFVKFPSGVCLLSCYFECWWNYKRARWASMAPPSSTHYVYVKKINNLICKKKSWV